MKKEFSIVNCKTILGAAALGTLLFTAIIASAQLNVVTNANDVATDPAYSGAGSPNGLSTGTFNGGSGFGAWTFTVNGTGGAFINTGSGPSGASFDLSNTTAANSTTALRPFNTPLVVGGAFSVQFRLNNLDNSNFQNGLMLQDSNGNVLFSFWHAGGDIDTGHYIDASTTNGVASGFYYHYQEFVSCTFTMNSTTSYTFKNNTDSTSFSGTVTGVVAQVVFFRANVTTNAPSNGQDFQFDQLVVTAPLPAPQFALQPTYQGGLVGSTITLGALALSSQPIDYQWYDNGVPVSGATQTNLVLSNVDITNAGSYFLVASNSLGSTTSSVAVVTVYVENNRLLAYEGFDYTGGATLIDGSSQDGGTGWSNAWLNVGGTANYIVDGSLVGASSVMDYTNVPPGYDARSQGNSYYNFAYSRAGRWLDCSTNSVFATRGYVNGNRNIGVAGKTLYVSFLMQPATNLWFYEFEFHRANLDDPGRVAGVGCNNVSSTNNDVYLRTPGGGFTDLGVAADSADTSQIVDFYVVRIDFHDGNDDVRVYSNPTSTTEPVTPTVTVTNAGDMSFNGISLGTWYGNYLQVDEIRLGATWADALGMAVSNLLPPTKQAGGWNIQFAGTPTFTYRVQRASSVTGPWTDLGTVTPSENGIGTFTDTTPSSGQAYYRTVTP